MPPESHTTGHQSSIIDHVVAATTVGPALADSDWNVPNLDLEGSDPAVPLAPPPLANTTTPPPARMAAPVPNVGRQAAGTRRGERTGITSGLEKKRKGKREGIKKGKEGKGRKEEGGGGRHRCGPPPWGAALPAAARQASRAEEVGETRLCLPGRRER